ncbi:hypothetical protein TanjilG_15964 [Lupinus angustifolius]|uniref:Cyclin-dependent protein kinase inhibitor SMR6 n=1 Tax=Lupinus angustifolius TaxID=3871 RepID=A0A4P1RGH4_LUPAN|nr:PREDICTED: uncharacterized protein LOC109350756 [Lupinus angustifolius]OIW10592.1 hypothetical protein TanjilG_15964 [Lupinus angustifolius]
MGFSKKPQVEESSDNRKWVIHGIALREPLKPIYTIPVEKEEGECDIEEECSTTTPTGEEARVPTTLTCPPAPKKRKPSLKYNYRGGGAREFFTPPDLETVFISHAESAK